MHKGGKIVQRKILYFIIVLVLQFGFVSALFCTKGGDERPEGLSLKLLIVKASKELRWPPDVLTSPCASPRDLSKNSDLNFQEVFAPVSDSDTLAEEFECVGPRPVG